MEDVLNYLDDIKIKYTIVRHPSVFTTIEADKYVEGMDGVFSKSLFMAGKKDKNFYLFIMDEEKKLDIKYLNNLIGERLHFGKEDDLQRKLGLVPGTVSLFGLLNNNEHDVNVYIDKDIMKEKTINFHPNDNTATIFISVDDMFKVLDDLNYGYKIIDF